MTASSTVKARRAADGGRRAPEPRRDMAMERRRPGRPSLSNEQLLDKALEVFLEQGFDGTSVDAITTAAGMAKRTLYQRYGDKKSLFKAALRRAIDEWIVPLDTLEAVETESLEETLLAVGRILVTNIMSPAGLRLLRITNAESGRLPEIGAYTYELGTARTIDYLARLLHDRLEPGGDLDERWREAGIAYLYLVVCGPPTMTAWGLKLDDATIDRHTRFGVRLFLHGLVGTVSTDDGSSVAVRAPTAMPTPSSEPAAGAGPDSENHRLRHMLVDAMLETARLRDEVAALKRDAANGRPGAGEAIAQIPVG